MYVCVYLHEKSSHFVDLGFPATAILAKNHKINYFQFISVSGWMGDVLNLSHASYSVFWYLPYIASWKVQHKQSHVSESRRSCTTDALFQQKAGLPLDGKKRVYKEIRPFMSKKYQNLLCLANQFRNLEISVMFLYYTKN